MMNLLVRADADIRIGTGHVMRCLALAQAWQDVGGKAVMAPACLAPGLEERLMDQRISVERLSARPGTDDDAGQTIGIARRLGAEWVVLDGYHFCGRFQRALKQAGHRVLVIDDYGHAEHYWADVVLNQNLHADESLYRPRESNTRLLLGTRFALLRREFCRWRTWTRQIPEVATKVLVTLGGSDPDNFTRTVIQALKQIRIEGLEGIILAGASNPHREELEATLAGYGAALRLQGSVTDISELMAWAEVAIAAGGSTSWERALMGLPSLVVILADNQRQIAEASERVGVGWNLGPHQLLSVSAVAGSLEQLMKNAAARARMARRGPELVDGQGATRVVGELRSADIWLRPAGAEDARMIWEWANEPAVRAVSFSTESIPWEQHQQWYATKLNDPSCAFYIAITGAAEPIGQVRCELSETVAVISISLDRRFRGAGHGTKVIRKGCETLFERGRIDTIHAFIRHGNTASFKAFEKAGFRKVKDTVVSGQPASLLELRK